MHWKIVSLNGLSSGERIIPACFFTWIIRKKQITKVDYGIFNQHQSKTEITKAIANLIQMPDIDVDADDTTIVSGEPEKPDQSLLT
jgi:hypothetical protein